MSSFSPAPRDRADARRNAQRILDATAELIAIDPGAGLEQVATRAGVSRTTLYHHFANRDALLDALTERSVSEVTAAVHSARPDEDRATVAMERILRAAWQVVGRYRGLVIVNPARIPRAELRARLEPALAPIRTVIERGQVGGEFDPEIPVEWLIGTLTDLIHAASRQVSAGAMESDEAERLLLRTVRGVLSSHQRG